MRPMRAANLLMIAALGLAPALAGAPQDPAPKPPVPSRTPVPLVKSDVPIKSECLITFDDERQAFQFRVNPIGVQADAVFSELDGFEDFS